MPSWKKTQKIIMSTKVQVIYPWSQPNIILCCFMAPPTVGLF